MISDKVVTYGETLKIPGHLSVGQYFLDCLRQNCRREGDRVALLNASNDENTTYDQLLKNTVHIANGLRKFGVKRGDVVGICSESNGEYMAAVMGALCCGATVTLFNSLYTKDELNHLLTISKPKLIFASATALQSHLETFKEAEFIEHIVQLSGDPTASGVDSLNKVMCECNEYSYEVDSKFSSEDTAFVFYSSGTTGLPKGVMLSHINILYVIASIDFGYLQDHCTNILTILPWYHVFGFVTTVQYLTRHKRVMFLTGFNPERYLNAIQQYEISCILIVPPIMVFLAKSPLVAKYDLSTVQGILCGAAPLSPQVTTEVFNRMSNVKILNEGYGLTETSLAVIRDLDELDIERGLVPVPGNKIKVVDINTNKKLGPDQEGEICVKSPSIMKGYMNNEEATRAMFDEEGYLKTGDVGYYNQDGHFFIIDRLKEIMKYKGNQVAPATIENVIMQHTAVADCGVVGKPDDAVGDLPTAFVVLKPGVNITEQDILEFTSSRLSPKARIRGGVIFVESIPKSPSGKILRRLLKQKLIEQN